METQYQLVEAAEAPAGLGLAVEQAALGSLPALKARDLIDETVELRAVQVILPSEADRIEKKRLVRTKWCGARVFTSVWNGKTITIVQLCDNYRDCAYCHPLAVRGEEARERKVLEKQGRFWFIPGGVGNGVWESRDRRWLKRHKSQYRRLGSVALLVEEDPGDRFSGVREITGTGQIDYSAILQAMPRGESRSGRFGLPPKKAKKDEKKGEGGSSAGATEKQLTAVIEIPTFVVTNRRKKGANGEKIKTSTKSELERAQEVPFEIVDKISQQVKSELSDWVVETPIELQAFLEQLGEETMLRLKAKGYKIPHRGHRKVRVQILPNNMLLGKIWTSPEATEGVSDQPC